MEREKLKVLPNDLQRSLSGYMFERHLSNSKDGIMGVMFRICGAKKYVPGRYNRVGRYKLNGVAWYEFLLPDGRYMSYIEDTVNNFNYELKIKNAEEKPLTDSEWEAVNLLLTNKVIKENKRWSFERIRRDYKETNIRFGRRLIQMRKRISNFKKERGIE